MNPRPPIAGKLIPSLGLAALAAWGLDRVEAAQRLAEIVLLPLERLHASAVVWLLHAGAVLDAHVDGHVVRSARFAYTIDPGCLGLPLIALLLVAVATSGATRRRRLWGSVAAIVVLVAVNLGRLVHLFHVGMHAPERFAWAHEVMWPVILVATTVLFWLRFRTATLPILVLLALVAGPAFAGPSGDVPPTYHEVLKS